jgi:hypothetical protein
MGCGVAGSDAGRGVTTPGGTARGVTMGGGAAIGVAGTGDAIACGGTTG